MSAPRKPEWLRKKIFQSERSGAVLSLIREKNLHTVCQGAKCPNLSECFDRGTATFMILGSACTRSCGFCAVSDLGLAPKHSLPSPDPSEPQRVAQAVKTLDLRHAVITSVTRDDLEDGGAGHFAATIRTIRELNPDTTIEILTPDFRNAPDALDAFVDIRPDIFNHNLETVSRLYSVRPGASYKRSLGLLQSVKTRFPDVTTKSGLMAGLGETDDEIREALSDLKAHDCDCVTIGQYLSPSEKHAPVVEFIPPERFEDWARFGREIGIQDVFSGPFVRSSYRAGEMADRCEIRGRA